MYLSEANRKSNACSLNFRDIYWQIKLFDERDKMGWNESFISSACDSPTGLLKIYHVELAGQQLHFEEVHKDCSGID